MRLTAVLFLFRTQNDWETKIYGGDLDLPSAVFFRRHRRFRRSFFAILIILRLVNWQQNIDSIDAGGHYGRKNAGEAPATRTGAAL